MRQPTRSTLCRVSQGPVFALCLLISSLMQLGEGRGITVSDVSALIGKLKANVAYRNFAAADTVGETWPVLERIARARQLASPGATDQPQAAITPPTPSAPAPENSWASPAAAASPPAASQPPQPQLQPLRGALASASSLATPQVPAATPVAPLRRLIREPAPSAPPAPEAPPAAAAVRPSPLSRYAAPPTPPPGAAEPQDAGRLSTVFARLERKA